jgi:hypothetical protein
MGPQNYQLIGSYLDVVFLFVVGLAGVFLPGKLVGMKGTEEERRKKIRILKVCGIFVLLVSIAKLLIKLS